MQERRNAIIETLKSAKGPVPAKQLAAAFGVSRQAIVQDLQVIRASGTNIASTARGYIMLRDPASGLRREFKVYHPAERMGEELNLICDCGGRILNISISHRVYGRIAVDLDIRSRADVEEFLAMFAGSKSRPLGETTSGYHYHLVEADSQKRLDLIEKRLQEAGFLAPLSEWEKSETR